MNRNDAKHRHGGWRGAIEARRHRRRLRPSVLPLEGRTLLSTTITVDNLTDTPVTGQTDLRQAIEQANTDRGADTIIFSNPFTTPQSITLTGGQLTLTDTVRTTITGPGANLLSVSGNNASRVFYINQGSASLSGLTITGGNADDGGGLDNNGGTLKLTDATVSGNSATFGGGGLFTGGYWNSDNSFTPGSSTLVNDIVSDNTASFGGGLEIEGSVGGGDYYTYSSATLNKVTISGNTGGGVSSILGDVTLTDSKVNDNSGGGLVNAGIMALTNTTISGNSNAGSGGGLFNTGTVSLTRSTVSGNIARINGGGLANVSYSQHNFTISKMTLTNSTVSGNTADKSGGGLFNYDGAATLTNTTISGNTATVVGGGLFNGGYFNVNTLSLTNTTVSRNSASFFGGGLYDDSGGNTTSLTNTIIAGQTAGEDVDGDIANFTGTHNLIGGDPRLAPLGDYGGPTQTMPLLPGSPALDAGSNALAVDTQGNPLMTDQRGFTRIVNTNVDIGAFEDQVVVNSPANQAAIPGQAASIDLGSFADSAPNPGNSTVVIDFGDGTADTTLTDVAPGAIGSVMHTFATSGTYTVTVTVTDHDHDANQATFTANVQPTTITAISASWGKAGTIALETNADGLRLLPSGRKHDLPFLNIQSFSITLAQAATLNAKDATITSKIGATYGPLTISGSGTSYTITLKNPIAKADRVTITIGNDQIASFNRRLDVLPGDVSDDGVVDIRDAMVERNMIFGIITPTVFGDLNGDGKQDTTDYNLARQRIGTRLP
jgi:hypothetical protein